MRRETELFSPALHGEISIVIAGKIVNVRKGAPSFSVIFLDCPQFKK